MKLKYLRFQQRPILVFLFLFFVTQICYEKQGVFFLVEINLGRS
jgi:hypothetical protein